MEYAVALARSEDKTLRMKASKVENYDAFYALTKEYGWEESLSAYLDSHDFDWDSIYDRFDNMFWNELLPDMLDNNSI